MEKKKKAKLVIGIAFAVLFVVFFTIVLPAVANGTECTAPNGYEMITNRSATDLNGNPLFILRGVIATGEGTIGGKKITLPPCGSEESSLATVNNMFIILDGKQVLLAAGSIGMDLANPTQEPQP